ncbi:lipopolysaccharide biosynthesis protein [Bacillota bacterium HCP3S3_E9]
MQSTSPANVIKNFFWRIGESSGAQLVSFLVSIVLARLLAPEDYGVIALVTVFTSILQVFVDSGLGTALVQKKNADEVDFSSVFYFNVLVCLTLYAGMFVAAPAIAKFYDNPIYIPLVRVLSLTLVISGLKNIQQAYVYRHMIFKRFFFSTLGGTIASAILGIVIAYAGFGVWALAAQYVSNTAIDTLILWITVPWRPKKRFSWTKLKSLLSYGWKLLVSALLDTGYTSLWNLLIGKVYSSADLSFYDQGSKYPKAIIGTISNSIDSVLLPTMSIVQDDRAQIKSMTRRSIVTSVYVMAPLMMGLAGCAEPLVSLILTDKWLPCVPYMRIFCITYMFWPVHSANLNAIKAMGRSDLFLRLEILKKIIGIGLLLCTMRISVMAMACSLLISSVTSQIINSYPNWKLLNYRYLEQLRDILPSILLAVIMAVAVGAVPLLGYGNVLTLCIQIPLGAVIYVAGSAIFRLESFRYLLNMIEDRRR